MQEGYNLPKASEAETYKYIFLTGFQNFRCPLHGCHCWYSSRSGAEKDTRLITEMYSKDPKENRYYCQKCKTEVTELVKPFEGEEVKEYKPDLD